MKILLNILGRLISLTPEFCLRGLCLFVAYFIMIFLPRRARIAYSNLSHCFEDMPKAQMDEIVKESAARMVEMALFVLASPYLSDKNLKSRIVISDRLLAHLKDVEANPRSVILLIPHFCMMETITMLPILTDINIPKTGVFYRPFDNKSMEDWIKKSRQRCGIDLLSRKDGLYKSFSFLRSNSCVAILFDQNAGASGTSSLFFDMICSTSDLSGILFEKFNPMVGFFYAQRSSFWHSKIDAFEFNASGAQNLISQANLALENHIKDNLSSASDWLWLHRRWRINGSKAFKLPYFYKSNLEEDFRLRGLEALPRKLRYFFSLPDDVRLAKDILTFFKALRASRCDAKFGIICPKGVSDKLILDDVDELICYEASSIKDKYEVYKQLKDRFIDLHVSFDTAKTADLCNKYMTATHTYAIELNEKRKGFNFVYKANIADFLAEPKLIYSEFFKKYGLQAS